MCVDGFAQNKMQHSVLYINVLDCDWKDLRSALNSVVMMLV